MYPVWRPSHSVNKQDRYGGRSPASPLIAKWFLRTKTKLRVTIMKEVRSVRWRARLQLKRAFSIRKSIIRLLMTAPRRGQMPWPANPLLNILDRGRSTTGKVSLTVKIPKLVPIFWDKAPEAWSMSLTGLWTSLGISAFQSICKEGWVMLSNFRSESSSSYSLLETRGKNWVTMLFMRIQFLTYHSLAFRTNTLDRACHSLKTIPTFKSQSTHQLMICTTMTRLCRLRLATRWSIARSKRASRSSQRQIMQIWRISILIVWLRWISLVLKVRVLGNVCLKSK